MPHLGHQDDPADRGRASGDRFRVCRRPLTGRYNRVSGWLVPAAAGTGQPPGQPPGTVIASGWPILVAVDDTFRRRVGSQLVIEVRGPAGGAVELVSTQIAAVTDGTLPGDDVIDLVSIG